MLYRELTVIQLFVMPLSYIRYILPRPPNGMQQVLSVNNQVDQEAFVASLGKSYAR